MHVFPPDIEAVAYFGKEWQFYFFLLLVIQFYLDVPYA